jgi:hypothetical protein
MNTKPTPNPALALIPEAFLITTVSLDIEFESGGAITVSAGDLLRDSIGAALYRLAYSHQEGDLACDCCVCRLFRPKVAGSSNAGAPVDLPAAFMLRVDSFPRGEFEKGERARVRLSVAGTEDEDITPLIQAVRVAGSTGVGRPRARFQADVPSDGITRIDRESIVAESALCLGKRELAVAFETPTLVRIAGKPKFGLSFAELIGSVLNRIHRGLAFHWHDPEIAERTRDLRQAAIAAASEVRIDSTDLRWAHVERVRGGGQKQSLSGFVGATSYSGDLDPFWPLVIAGSYTHIGYGAAFGMGRYSFDIRAEL